MAAVDFQQFLRRRDTGTGLALPRRRRRAVLRRDDHEQRRLDARRETRRLVGAQQVEAAQGELIGITPVAVLARNPLGGLRAARGGGGGRRGQAAAPGVTIGVEPGQERRLLVRRHPGLEGARAVGQRYLGHRAAHAAVERAGGQDVPPAIAGAPQPDARGVDIRQGPGEGDGFAQIGDLAPGIGLPARPAAAAAPVAVVVGEAGVTGRDEVLGILGEVEVDDAAQAMDEDDERGRARRRRAGQPADQRRTFVFEDDVLHVHVANGLPRVGLSLFILPEASGRGPCRKSLHTFRSHAPFYNLRKNRLI